MKLFKKQGWIYVPVHGFGWLITGVLMVLATGLFVGIDRHAHSASDTLIGFLPYGTSLAAIYFFIAINTSTNKNDNNNERNNNESRNLRNKGVGLRYLWRYPLYSGLGLYWRLVLKNR
jgi:hypothetical protein